MKKIMLGTSDAWLTIRLSQRSSNPAYYIVNWRILRFLIIVEIVEIKGFSCVGASCHPHTYIVQAKRNVDLDKGIVKSKIQFGREQQA